MPKTHDDNLLTRLYPDLWRFAMRLTRHRAADAEDLLQEAILRQWLRGSKPEEADLGSWIRGFMVNLMRDRVKAAARRHIVALADDLAESRVYSDELPESRLLAEDLHQAMSCLLLREREVLLRWAQGYGSLETADLQGSCPATVRRRITRALVNVKRRLAAA